MAKKPDQPKPMTWTIYKLAAKAERLGNRRGHCDREGSGGI
jgi:hypothetical protein